MLTRIKNIFYKTDLFLYKKFGSYKSTKILENINEAQLLFSYLNVAGEEDNVRFVGGCVRRAIHGEDIDDIDLATSLKPSEIKEKLSDKNVKLIDTGISHGTITVILNGKKFEITSLRKDISTDGRHANVEFSNNWEEDANRRDFTVNAIYSDINGRIFDPLDGISDLQNGTIKFIGNAEERIQEDYLRILRYFRFFIQYSKANHNPEIIQSIKKYINGINKISRERIFDELEKILKLGDFDKLFLDKNSKEIILNIFPQFKHYKRLNIFKGLNREIRNRFDKYLILALIIVDETNDYEFFCHKYKVSKKISKKLENIAKNFENIKNKKFYSEENIKKIIYFSSKEDVIDLLLFSLCSDTRKKNINIENLIKFVDAYKIPKFPISGEDLKEKGYQSGELIGKKLKLLEQRWIDSGFIMNKKKIKKYLEEVDKN